jgi:hypothetical protein
VGDLGLDPNPGSYKIIAVDIRRLDGYLAPEFSDDGWKIAMKISIFNAGWKCYYAL